MVQIKMSCQLEKLKHLWSIFQAFLNHFWSTFEAFLKNIRILSCNLKWVVSKKYSSIYCGQDYN
jgi:hypothetical protein